MNKACASSRQNIARIKRNINQFLLPTPKDNNIIDPIIIVKTESNSILVEFRSMLSSKTIAIPKIKKIVIVEFLKIFSDFK